MRLALTLVALALLTGCVPNPAMFNAGASMYRGAPTTFHSYQLPGMMAPMPCMTTGTMTVCH